MLVSKTRYNYIESRKVCEMNLANQIINGKYLTQAECLKFTEMLRIGYIRFSA